MENFSWIDNMVKDKIVAQKLQFYRQYSPAPQPNDQAYK